MDDELEDVIHEVCSIFPNAKQRKIQYRLNENELVFVDKDANKNWNDLSWSMQYGSLWVHMSHKMTIDKYKVTVRCKPGRILLVTKKYINGSVLTPTISFPSAKTALKRGGFDSDDIYKKCRHSILEFLRQVEASSSWGYNLDLSNADKSLTKILNIR